MKKKIKTYVGASAFAIITLLLGILPMLTAGQAGETNKASTLPAAAEMRDVQRVLSGGGPLTAVEEATVTIPEGVKITSLLAANGDVLKAGDPIALVDKVSVMSAVTQVQETLESIGKQLKTVSAKISAGAITVDDEGNIYSGGKKVESSKLTDYANYLTLSMEHRDYEQMLLELFLMNQNGSINAPKDGLIDGLSQSVVSKTASTGSAKLSLLAAHTPEGDDELTYTGFVGVVNSVSDSGWNMLMNPTPYIIDDFAHPKVNTSLMGMSMTGIHAAEPVMVCSVTAEKSEEDEESEEPTETVEWSTTDEIQSGDLLLFTYCDGSPAWVIKLGKANMPNFPGDPTRPGGGTGIGGIDWDKIKNAMSAARGGGSYAGSQEEEKYSTAENYLCTVVPQEKMILTVSIDEQDIAQVQPGMTAAVSIDALPKQNFTGTVTEVSKFGSGNGGSSKFAVKLELDYAEGMLPGMNASATLVMETRSQILTIPVAALVEQGTKTVVFTGYDAKNDVLLNPVEVETGLSDGEYVQILSGLEPGTPFWYTYYDTLEISNAVESRSLFG